LNCVSLGTAPAGSIPLGTANGIFISKTLRGGMSWSKGRSSLGVNVFDTRRQYQQISTLPEDEIRGMGATYGYRLQPHTTLNASIAYTNTLVPAGLELLSTDRNDDLYVASLGVSHRFDPNLSGTLTLRHQQRKSNDAAFNFDENSISASASMRF
jgi:uncharacterized protein (PEP-CTERM system associated)